MHGDGMRSLMGMQVGLVARGVDDDVGPQQITQDVDFKQTSLARPLKAIDVRRSVHLKVQSVQVGDEQISVDDI